MKEDSVVELKMKGPIIDDAITDILRKGARQLLAQALEAEIELFIDQFAEMRDEQGRQRIVRNGYHRQRDHLHGLISVRGWNVRNRNSSVASASRNSKTACDHEPVPVKPN